MFAALYNLDYHSTSLQICQQDANQEQPCKIVRLRTAGTITTGEIMLQEEVSVRMDDQRMREALRRKLSDPQWKAEQERRYRQIVGEAPAPARPGGRHAAPTPRLETI